LGPGDEILALLAELLDAERHDVARLQIPGLGLLAEPDAGRRAGGDDMSPGSRVMNCER
jgi:hypothetical protein